MLFVLGDISLCPRRLPQQNIYISKTLHNIAIHQKLFHFSTSNYPRVFSPVDLTLHGGNAILHLETLFKIECPVCPSCAGGIYLIYDGETTPSIASSATAPDIQAALLALKTLSTASVYGDLTSYLNVTMDGGGSTLCDSLSPMITSISLRSSYGNLPSLRVINSLRMVDAHEDGGNALVSLSLVAPKGDKENEYCANHGICDFATGTCVCDRNTTAFPDEWYWWESSDGYGRPGARPDCGYQRVESTTNVLQGCPVGVVFANESAPRYGTMDKVKRGCRNCWCILFSIVWCTFFRSCCVPFSRSCGVPFRGCLGLEQ